MIKQTIAALLLTTSVAVAAPTLTASIVDNPANDIEDDTFRTVTTMVTDVTEEDGLCSVHFDAPDTDFPPSLPVAGGCGITWQEAYDQWNTQYNLIRLNGVDLDSPLRETATSYVVDHGASEPTTEALTAAPTHDDDGNRISGRYNIVDDTYVNPDYNYPGALHDLYNNDPANPDQDVIRRAETPRTTLELPGTFDLRSIPRATVCEYYAHENDDARLSRLRAELTDPSISYERKEFIVGVLGSEINRGSCNNNGRQDLIILWGEIEPEQYNTHIYDQLCNPRNREIIEDIQVQPNHPAAEFQQQLVDHIAGGLEGWLSCPDGRDEL